MKSPIGASWEECLVLSLIGWSVVPTTFSGQIQSLVAATRDAAYAKLAEKTNGTHEPEKLPDLVVVSQDLFHAEPPEIHKAKMLLPLVGRNVEYREGI
jgi:hypothetical protein